MTPSPKPNLRRLVPEKTKKGRLETGFQNNAFQANCVTKWED
jgi:hypothetical protein